MSARRWRLHLHPKAAERSGSLARILGVFADRGVSLDEVHAAVIDDEPVVRLRFEADERSACSLRRRLERVAEGAVVSEDPD